MPALPTSIGPSGARSPRSPQPCTRRRVPASSSRSTRAPSASTAASVASVSAFGPKPVTSRGAVGDRAEQQRAVRDRLVAGDGELADERRRGRDLQAVGAGRRAHVASASTGAASAP